MCFGNERLCLRSLLLNLCWGAGRGCEFFGEVNKMCGLVKCWLVRFYCRQKHSCLSWNPDGKLPASIAENGLCCWFAGVCCWSCSRVNLTNVWSVINSVVRCKYLNIAHSVSTGACLKQFLPKSSKASRNVCALINFSLSWTWSRAYRGQIGWDLPISCIYSRAQSPWSRLHCAVIAPRV